MSDNNIDKIHNIYIKDEITEDKFKPPYIDNNELDKEQYKNQNFYNTLRDIPNARPFKDIADHLEYPIILDRPITKTYYKYKYDETTLNKIKDLENFNKISLSLNICFFILILIIIIIFFIILIKNKNNKL